MHYLTMVQLNKFNDNMSLLTLNAYEIHSLFDIISQENNVLYQTLNGIDDQFEKIESK
jgi:hypothetical protein